MFIVLFFNFSVGVLFFKIIGYIKYFYKRYSDNSSTSNLFLHSESRIDTTLSHIANFLVYQFSVK